MDREVAEALQRLEAGHKAFVRDVSDSFLVLANLERKQTAQIKANAEEADAHAKRMQRMEITLSEMTEKVNFIIDREMNREGGMQSK